ncbi:MAG: DNA methylase [Oscillospiraceae bacterium]|nr:DNA methylase [Oscillospiraceae bacterium]
MEKERTYIAIDLKSFYASVECVDRHLDPMTTNLVVADASRTEKTICLAVSPSLKAWGIPGRARLFEVVQRVREVNNQRLGQAIRQHKAIRVDNETGLATDSPKNSHYTFASSSFDDRALKQDPSLELGYIVAPPQMRRYMEVSTSIYNIYLHYVSKEDILVYSIDEVFMDVTHYLSYYHMTARELAMTMVREVLYTTGITATCGIGTNMYLAKVAMDIVAKHAEPDKDGVRMAELTERSYRELLWAHEPITDFWRVGRGIAKKLAAHGMYTMGDVARCSIGSPDAFHNEELLYKLFGVNAELLIDHAWGWEPTTMEQVRQYKPENNSVSSGQVLHEPYDYPKTRLIVREMTDLMVLDLVDKGLVTDQLTLTIGYDIENLKNGRSYSGPVVTDHYGRKIPKHAHGTANLDTYCSSTAIIMDAMMALFTRIADEKLLVRRVTITANHLLREEDVPAAADCEQLSLFTDLSEEDAKRAHREAALKKERQMQRAMLDIKKKYGKNAILKGMNLQEGATTISRNRQVGGHKA